MDTDDRPGLVQVKTYIDAHSRGELEHLAQQADRSLASEVRRAIRRYIEGVSGSSAKQLTASLPDLLARVVAAREEQALGEHEQAAAILADLEADLAADVEREAP